MTSIQATQFVGIQIIDKEVIMLTFKDGDIVFKDDAKGPSAYLTSNDATENSTVLYGKPLNVENVAKVSSWMIRSADDPSFDGEGRRPVICFRKSKINGMGQYNWNNSLRDYNYESPLQHHVFLIMPVSLKENCTYTIVMDTNTETDKNEATVTFDIFNSRSEAVHVNIVGYSPTNVLKSADVYMWLGDGKARNYNTFTGNAVYLYNIDTKTKNNVGKLKFWKDFNNNESRYNFTQSSVWDVDFSTNVPPGNYRIAIEGIGCSDDFEIKRDIYKVPFDVSVRGFFYMRIGEDCMECVPVPRRPLYIPGVSPANTKVYITTMQPFHADWGRFSGGDYWDNPNDWIPYKKEGSPTNERATGGHSDALDWDRHLGHVSIIYDMLLPFYLTEGELLDDNCNIRESGNGIPDLLDEARNEVDFWLHLRDGKGYSHGLTNPNSNNELYQAGTTTIAAWANAVNSAMLAYCFQLSGHHDLEKNYLDSAVVAFNYAANQPDQMLDRGQDMGSGTVRGKDLKMTAAVFLYNLTGDTKYEDIFYDNCDVKTDNAVINDNTKNQLWGIAAYLSTQRAVNYPALYENIRKSVIYQAHRKEADYINTRPSKRGVDHAESYFHTVQNMHRTIVAHAVTTDAKEKEFFLRAMILEADWGLGRNPLNIIQMTTATTPLEHKRSVVNIYTTGRNDGTPGMHPGHTPYLNIDDWAPSMVMGRPSWMYQQSYPSDVKTWPVGELYFDTRYVWTHSEFTPQQTMRGKMALYGYLHAIEQNNKIATGPLQQQPAFTPLEINIYPNPASGEVRVFVNPNNIHGDVYNLKLYDFAGQQQLSIRSIAPETIIHVNHLPVGIYLLTVDSGSSMGSVKLLIER